MFMHMNTVFVSVCVCGKSCHSTDRCFPWNSEEAKAQGDSGVGHCCGLLPDGPSSGHSGTE